MGVSIVVDRSLVLRELRLADAKELFEVIDENRSSLREFLPWLDFNLKVSDSENFILNSSRFNLAGTSLVLCLQHEGKIRGMLSLVGINKMSKSASVGYWICKSARGRGLVTRSVVRLLEYSFENLHLNRIEIRAAPENSRSRVIPERLGFKEEGLLREVEWLYDHYTDLVVYSFLKREWQKNAVRASQ